MELEPQPSSAWSSCWSYALSLVRERAGRHGIELRPRRGRRRRGGAVADPLRFKQVVLNLLSNAVKFTPDGGRVTSWPPRWWPTSSPRPPPTPAPACPPRTGSGSSSPSNRAARGTTREEGTGLGLTLTKRIVELFGGRLWLDTTVGEGSTFGFSLPVRASLRPPADVPPGRRLPCRCCCSSTTTVRRWT